MMTLLSKVSSQMYTHSCPGCGKPTYCACMAGKSPSTCWCFAIDMKKIEIDNDLCMCKECLLKYIEEHKDEFI